MMNLHHTASCRGSRQTAMTPTQRARIVNGKTSEMITVPQVRRTNWNFEQINRFQPSPPPPQQFQPQRAGHPQQSQQQQYQYRHHLGQDSWTGSQTIAHQATRTRSWPEPRPTFHHAPTGEAAALRYTLSSFPVAQTHQRGGYVMQVHPRSASFEQLRSPREQHILLHSQATPPVRRYEDRRRQYHRQFSSSRTSK